MKAFIAIRRRMWSVVYGIGRLAAGALGDLRDICVSPDTHEWQTKMAHIRALHSEPQRP